MTNKISFLIPESEIIPTRLRLLVEKEDGEDIKIEYSRLYDTFGYEFILHNITSEEEAKSIVDEIARKMIAQSYDHGQEWRVTEIEKVNCEINYAFKRAEYRVKFRIKDTW